MGSEKPQERETSIVVADTNANAPTTLFAPVKSATEELPPLSAGASRGSVLQEPTIRQVAPLVLILTGASFLNTTGVQSVVIILPSITRDLHIPETRQEWIVSAYGLTSAAFLLLCGKLSDVYGKRLLFILGCFWLTATTLGAAFSPNEICMYTMRALQGLGAAITIPTAIGIIGYTIPPGRVKNYSFAFYSGGAPMGQVLGNLLGGIISEYANWKVVFFVIAGVAFVIGAIAIFVVPKEPPSTGDAGEHPRASGIDWTGAFLFTSGTLLLLIALSEGVAQPQGWRTPFVIAILLVSVLFLGLFIFWQHYLEKISSEPLMRVSTFKTGRFSAAMVIVFFFSAGFTNFLVYSTYYYQDLQLLSPIQTTLRYIPLGICGIFSIFCSGYFMARIRGNYILIFGLGSALIANIIFAVPIPPSTTYWAYGFPAMCLAAFGADTTYPCIGLFTTQSLPRKDQGVAGAMFQTIAGLGRAMFLPITATIQSSIQTRVANSSNDASYAYLEGLRGVEWFCVACMAISLLITVFGLRNIGKIGLLKKLGNVQSAAKEKDEET
ncbi:MFS multidrug transporter-like protein [Mollisia scopiformis]|uniref:MFS multidrug transporter-like protein n=1 Tax=Mollisia scopiformis TaxID=149040 RepID=A0A194XV59_MOLSC|nr:MFS multidrug transporter-like protein [Mollisia scopiformis]KUJ23914.1 MFS multidrug transporter-like protein [Mollisia scopiformis]